VVLPRAWQPAQEHGLAPELLVGRGVPGAGRVAKEQEPAVAGREPKRAVEAPHFFDVLPKQGDLVEQFLRVRADAAADVGLGHERQQVAPGRLADLDRQPGRVLAVHEEEWNEVVPDDGADGLPLRERDTEPPEDGAGPDRPAPGGPAGGDAAAKLDAGARGLGHVVQKRCQEEDAAVGLRQLTPRGQGHHRLRDQVDVGPNVPLRVPVRILRAALQVLHPRQRVEGRPVDRPVPGVRARQGHSVLASLRSRWPATDGYSPDNRFGRIGRRSQCVPESKAADKKSALTYLYRAFTSPSSSTFT